MLDEGSGAMEKKPPPRQSPAQPKNNGVISEKKSDYVSNKNGRPKKCRQSNGGGRSQEPSQNPKPVQKYSQSYSDKRPRQRGYFNYRQSEEVAETEDLYDVGDRISSRKGNANHLLQFSYTPRGESSRYGAGRGTGGSYGRGGHWYSRKTPARRYSPEQFLQASCQFVVREGGEYAEQAIDPDALVSWDMVELVRTFSTETVTCPICLEVPYAGKITKCGHTFCWACILHHLQEKEMNGQRPVCPICPHRISMDELRSVQSLEVPDYKVGDEIEMKLMRKSKGSVYVSPKSEWKDRGGIPHNIGDGDITHYMKLLLASGDQIQHEVIDPEKAALGSLVLGAEESETCYISMAQSLLEKREENLKLTIQALSMSNLEKDDHEQSAYVKPETETAEAAEVKPLPPDVSYDGTKIATNYIDAFENKEESDNLPSSVGAGASTADETSLEVSSISLTLSDDAFLPGDDENANTGTLPVQGEALGQLTEGEDAPQMTTTEDVAGSPQPSSPTLILPLMSQEPDTSGLLTPEEAYDSLELPLHQRNSSRTKDTYYFYQASTGQHIYMNSLNAQCLTKEYGSLEHSPETIKATIVAIERIFMTEDVRKRLRYLNHIPLTCEFHVVELKIAPPVVSKQTLKHFQPEFDKRRRTRQRKLKEEKVRARHQEVEHKKTFGIYPEVKIPLDNLAQFPSHLGSSQSTSALSSMVGGTDGSGRQRQDSEIMSTGSETASEPSCEGGAGSPSANSPRSRNDSEGSQTGTMSFAEMLKAGKSVPQSGVWGHATSPNNTLHTSATMPELRATPSRRRGMDDEDDEDQEYLPAPSMMSSWFDGFSKLEALNNRHQSLDDNGNTESPVDTKGGKKKKKKKQKDMVLFSTSMARKG